MNKNNYVVLLLALAAVAAVAHWSANKSLALIAAAALFTPLSVHVLITALRSGRLLALGSVWLALPYFLFAFYWLNGVGVLLLSAAVGGVLWRQVCLQSERIELSREDILALIIGLVWFSLAGIGGVGYQSIDWIMHNGRLVDLTLHEWPVIYREGALINSEKWPHDTGVLTGYFAFQLPAAWIGKLFDSLEVARLIQYLWAWFGFALLLLAGKLLGYMQRPLILILGLALFAGSDVILFFHREILTILLQGEMTLSSRAEDFAGPLQWMLTFWSAGYFNYFFGVFLPPAAQFHLAPNQVIAIWLSAMGLLYSHQRQQYVFGVGWIALLFFWSPFGAIGLAIFWGLLSLQAGSLILQLRAWSVYLPVLVLLFVFLLFYRVFDTTITSGVMRFAWDNPEVTGFWRKFFVFHLISWSVYAAVFAASWSLLSVSWRQVLLASFGSLLVISVLDYGLFSDLKMRAAAGLYFILMLGMLEVLRCCWRGKRRWLACLLLLVFLVCALSHIMYIVRDVLAFHTSHDDVSVINYPWGYEFLRRVDDAFMCYLSAETTYCARP